MWSSRSRHSFDIQKQCNRKVLFPSREKDNQEPSGYVDDSHMLVSIIH